MTDQRFYLPVTRRALMMSSTLGLIWSGVLLLTPEAQYVALPAAVVATLTTLFLFTIWRRSGELPVFEIGTVFAVIMALYSIVPAVNFISGGPGWTSLSDGRLLFYNPQSREVGDFLWRYVALVAGFVTAYLKARGRNLGPLEAPVVPDKWASGVLFALFVACWGYQRTIEYIFGIVLSPSYLGGGLQAYAEYYNTPYFVQQVTHNVVGAMLAIKLCLIGLLLLHWRSAWARVLVIGWIAAEIAMSFANMGSRTYMALLVFGTLLLYHRLVFRLRPWMAIAGAVVMLSGFVIYGAMRDWGGSITGAYQQDARVWTANNDFQTMFGTAYDVEMTRTRVGLGAVPWQVYVSDLYLLIPSQFLPFDKIEPSTWYYTLIASPTSQMFGIISQSVVGFGWPELLLRGLVLGFVFAKLHRWYVIRSRSYWWTLFYAYACIWCHYVFRSTMIWPAYFVVYEFVPVMLVTTTVARYLRRHARAGGGLVLKGST